MKTHNISIHIEFAFESPDGTQKIWFFYQDAKPVQSKSFNFYSGQFIYQTGKVQCQVMHVCVHQSPLAEIWKTKYCLKSLSASFHKKILSILVWPCWSLFSSAKNTIPEDAFTLGNTM